MQYFYNMKVSIFGTFGLKTSFTLLKIGIVLDDLTPQWGGISTKPKKHTLALVCIVLAIKRENLLMGINKMFPVGGFAPNLEEVAVTDVIISAKFLGDRLRGSILWGLGRKLGVPI